MGHPIRVPLLTSALVFFFFSPLTRTCCSPPGLKLLIQLEDVCTRRISFLGVPVGSVYLDSMKFSLLSFPPPPFWLISLLMAIDFTIRLPAKAFLSSF